MAPRVGSSILLDYPSTATKSTTTTSSMNSGSSATTVAMSNNHHIRNTLRSTIPEGRNQNDIDSANYIHVHNIVANNFTDSSSQHVGSVLRKQVGLLAGKTAKRRLNELRNTSRLPRAQHDFLSSHEEHYDHEDEAFDDLHRPLRLSWDEIFVEDMLGMGGFGSVCLVTCPKLRKQREKEQRKAANARSARTSGAMVPGHESYTASHYGNEDVSMNGSFAMTADDSTFGGSMMLSYASTTTATGYEKPLDPNKYYACKSLSNKTIKQANVRGFVQAAADLVHEAFLLSHITPHSNIVRLYGIPSCDIESAFIGGDDEDSGGSDLGYFLILEALGGGILSDKICDWKQQHANMMREQKILRQRREQQLQRQKKKTPAPPSPNSPTLGSFLSSPVEAGKSHAKGRRGSITSENSGSRNGSVVGDLPDFNSLALHQNYQIPTIEERLDVALQIASGMQHLHSHGVIFRDLKPHNVGLSVGYGPPPTTDANSYASPQQPQHQSLTWRLFDFGLAREVPMMSLGSPRTMAGSKGSHSGVSSDPSVVYGKAGSLRYMAPETMGGRWLRSSKHQNSSCFATFGSDVYSFAIVLWELVGLQSFDNKYDTSPEDFESAVCDRGHRPGMEALDTVIDQMDVPTEDESEAETLARNQRRMNIRELVHACWREDYRQRPTFQFIVDTLKTMLPKTNDPSEATDGDEDYLVDDITVATDNLNDPDLDASALSMSINKGHAPGHHMHRTMGIDPQGQQQIPRMSAHSYKSHSHRSGASRRLKRMNSKRSCSTRSMMSAQSMSTHSMVLEDVFELDTEHSQSTGSRSQKRSDHKYDLDDDDLDEDDDDLDDDNEEMANDVSLTNLMNESVITIENKSPGGGSSKYLNYNTEYNDENNDSITKDDSGKSSSGKSGKSKKKKYSSNNSTNDSMLLGDFSVASSKASGSKKLSRPKSTSSLAKKKKKKNRRSSKSSHC